MTVAALNVRRLLSNLANIDRDMEVRVVGDGPLLATYLAVAKNPGADNIAILSAIEAEGFIRLDGGDGTTPVEQYPEAMRQHATDRDELLMAVAGIQGAITNARRFINDNPDKFTADDLDAAQDELVFTNQWLRDFAQYVADEKGARS